MTAYYPLFMNIEGQPCLVVGGGEVAARKVNSLLECGARVSVVSPWLCDSLRSLRESGKIEAALRGYRDGDTRGSVLVIAATDDSDLNARIYREASASRIPVNVVDAPGQSTFIVPSVFKRGDVTIAISTGGRSPALAKRIRIALENALPAELGELADMLSEVRQELKRRRVSVTAETWQDALDIDVLLSLLRQGKRGDARERLMEHLTGDNRVVRTIDTIDGKRG
ncbi:MAG: bifunctional precorrin-2 dehydrogenase/sirohydrochlorin ferrochelatase [Chloroflexi bacterium]|nr:bifunctional precorrin-2 dehydrogenase/sirohydrochlorin ferrochelatase [Chloroflexota bacterium]